MRTSFFILAAMGFLIAGRALGEPQKGPPGKAGFAPPPPIVLVTAARTDTIAEPRTFVGTVKPIRKSLVGSAAAGRVEQYLVNEGDAVKAGQPIAHLRRGLIQAELDAAKGQLLVRESELGWMEKSHREEIEQSQAKYARAQAQLSFRQAKLDRSKALTTSVSRELYEEDSSLAAQATAELREAQSALRMLTEGARQMKTEQARGWVEAQRAEVQRLQEQFDRHTLFAPFDGYVSAEHTEVGQWVMQGDPVAEIVELKTVDVEIAVLEDFIANVQPGLEGRIEVPAAARQPFAGAVSAVSPQGDVRARTFPVKVRVVNEFVNDQPLLKANMLARVTLDVGKPTASVLVPKDAVVLGGPMPVVFVAAPMGDKTSVRPVPVTLGPAQGAWIGVFGELKEADLVIVEGNERVRPGQEVRTEMKEVAYP
jgi:RND family efflux transporter MFP subunit